MSDPRNVAHDKKVTQEKKHQGTAVLIEDAAAVQPGKKPATTRNATPSAAAIAEPADSPTAKEPAPELEGSLVVLSKLKELEFHSRAHLERLAELVLTVDDELKQTQIAGPLGEVYSAQSEFQTKLTALIETYKAECDRMQGETSVR
jgi:hypothetical protein